MSSYKTIQIINLQEDGRVFVDMPDDDSNPCSTCGACCSHFRVSFYQGELDAMPGGTVPENMTVNIGGFRACMSGTEYGSGRCVALQGEIGQGPISCSIYQKRPSVCREYPVWEEDGTPNTDCQRLREKIGLKPLLPQKKTEKQ